MYKKDMFKSIQDRVEWIKNILDSTNAKGIIYGNSGGKDCTLVGALAKLATDNVLGVIMPCESKQNYASDKDDAILAGEHFGIEQIEVDLTSVKKSLIDALGDNFNQDECSEYDFRMSNANVNPRLRMTILYTLAQSKGYLVAGTGNIDEITMGYFTKWGDGAYDFNPIADLNVEEVYAYLHSVNCPQSIIEKAPSAGLYEGQTDELEMGVTYKEIDAYLRGENISFDSKMTIENAKNRSKHKLRLPLKFGEK